MPCAVCDDTGRYQSPWDVRPCVKSHSRFLRGQHRLGRVGYCWNGGTLVVQVFGFVYVRHGKKA
jgi:hypothetical protein